MIYQKLEIIMVEIYYGHLMKQKLEIGLQNFPLLPCVQLPSIKLKVQDWFWNWKGWFVLFLFNSLDVVLYVCFRWIGKPADLSSKVDINQNVTTEVRKKRKKIKVDSSLTSIYRRHR